MKSRRILTVVLAALALAVAIPVAASASSNSQPKIAPHIVGTHVVGTWPNDANGGGPGGYEVWSTGKVVAVGDAPYYGSAKPGLNDIVGFAADSDSEGYWLIGANGQIYPEGSTCANKTLVGPADRPTSGVIGAINLKTPSVDGFAMVTKSNRTYAFSCQVYET
jgi:hypothetical protein